MATNLVVYYSESDGFVDGQYKLVTTCIDFTFKRRVLYGVTKSGVACSVTKTNETSKHETRTFTLTLPSAGTVRGITHNRDFLVGIHHPDVGTADRFCYWDYSGNLIFSIANRPGNIGVYEQLTFLRHHYYVVTLGASPAICSVFKIAHSTATSADLVNEFNLVDKGIAGVTHDGHSLWFVNQNATTLDNFSTTGTLIRQEAFPKAMLPGIAFNRRYKLVSTS